MRLAPGVTSAAVLLIALGCAFWSPPASALSACPAQWYVSYGGYSSYTLLNLDPDNLPLSSLYFSRSYNDPTDDSGGYLDFDHDRKSDIFSAIPSLATGDYQWRYSSGGTGPWINLAHDSTPPDQLRFGDFNSDGYTDVFSITPIAGGNYQWRYSQSGTSSWVNLSYASTPLDQLRFGDFNADGKTDVFLLTDLGGGQLGWLVSYGGTLSFIQINSSTQPLSELAFGDINDDGHTDVFTTLPAGGGTYDWYYSLAGSNPFQYIATRNQSVHDVLLAGNFDNAPASDHINGTDFFYTTLRLDGNYQWSYFHYLSSPPVTGDLQLAYAATPPSDLRFADFNGDGITDVFMLVPCDRIFGSDFE